MDEEVVGKVYDRRLFGRLITYLRPYRRAVLAALAFLVVTALLQTVGPLLTRLAIDRYLVPGPAAPAPPPAPWPLDWLAADPWTGIAQISLLYLLGLVLGLVAELGQQWLMQRTGQFAMFDLRREIMMRLQALDLSYFDRNPVGRLVTRVTTDVDVLNELFASGLVTILGDILVLSLVTAAMLQLSPGLTLILWAVMPLVVLATVRFRRVASASYRRVRIAVAKINAYLQEHVSGVAVLQLFNREARASARFQQINAEHMEAYKESIIAYGWFYPVVEFLGMLAVALLLAYGGFRIQQGELTLGVMVAFFQYALRFFRPIQDLSEKYNILQGAMAASERVFALLDTGAAVTSPAQPRPFPDGAVAIEFDQVWFAYQDEDWVLRDVSFRIAPGETIAVVGHTGAGKTTLTNLLLRLYDVQRGAVRVGGVDVRELDLVDLRRHFAIVLQDPYLFTGTLGDNIRLGTPGITDEHVAQATERVNLGEFVRSLPDQFAHPVRERGAGLSTGQKQLISFARALAHDPEFLILDEATSSVDTETELRVRDALQQLVTGRTSLVIAHRLSTIQRADRIFVMHKGQLREVGTHQELLAQRGLYWRLYQLQYKDQELKTA